MVKKVKTENIFENGLLYIKEFFSNGAVSKTLKPSTQPLVHADPESEVSETENLLAEVLLNQANISITQKEQANLSAKRYQELSEANAELLLNQVENEIHE